VDAKPPLDERPPVDLACPKCGADGVYRRATTLPKNAFEVRMDVRCTGCSHEWSVTTPSSR
jgi:hypothetical protein